MGVVDGDPSGIILHWRRTEDGLALRGEVDASNAELFQEILALEMDGRDGYVVLDLEALEFMDGKGIRVLLRLPERSTRANGFSCSSRPATS